MLWMNLPTVDSKLYDNPHLVNETSFIDGLQEENSKKYIIVMTVYEEEKWIPEHNREKMLHVFDSNLHKQ